MESGIIDTRELTLAKVRNNLSHVICVCTATDLVQAEAGLATANELLREPTVVNSTIFHASGNDITPNNDHTLSLVVLFSKLNSLLNRLNVFLQFAHSIVFGTGKAIITNFATSRAHTISPIDPSVMAKHLAMKAT